MSDVILNTSVLVFECGQGCMEWVLGTHAWDGTLMCSLCCVHICVGSVLVVQVCVCILAIMRGSWLMSKSISKCVCVCVCVCTCLTAYYNYASNLCTANCYTMFA